MGEALPRAALWKRRDPPIRDVGPLLEQLRRTAHGRLLALLMKRTGDLLDAEEVLGHAFARAVATWPERGVPEKPEAWLFTVARNRWIDELRRRRREAVAGEPTEPPAEEDDMQDHRLPLLFLCAHPAIAESVRTPLMLQTVLGLDAATVARVFAQRPATMAQRLVRAKRKIRDARIPFVVPDAVEERLQAVLEAIYGAYSAEHLADRGLPDGDLRIEALELADLLARMMPRQAEVLGLAALLRYAWARRRAIVVDGVLVPIDEQDVGQWSAADIDRAEATLARAHRLRAPGPFQIEAAIQAVHCARRATGQTDWRSLLALFEGLRVLRPSRGSLVGRAAVVGRVVSPQEGLRCLNQLGELPTFQPAWAVRAWLLAQAGRAEEAVSAYEHALSLTTDGPTRAFLVRRRDEVAG